MKKQKEQFWQLYKNTAVKFFVEMKFKETLLIFLLGAIVGVGVSPLVSKKPQEIIQSPVAVSMAQTQDLVLPLSEGEVLGVMEALPAKKQITFGDLLPAPVMQKSEEETQQDKRELERLAENNQNSEKIALVSGQTTTLSQKSGSLTITVLGDSMVDTMGPGLPYIEKALKKYYPNYFFDLLNYGAGATNIEYGIWRLTNDYEYLDKKIPALVSTNPDIVIVESFAYNPWGADKTDMDKHWLSLAKIVDILKNQTQAKILLLATIAPNKANFGAGPAGINWDKGQAWQHAEKINLYLENIVRFAASQGLPAVDAYHPSIVNGDGNLAYINPGDHIHYSVAGCEFVADLIAKKLVSLDWIK